jgi:hypothetical protein
MAVEIHILGVRGHGGGQEAGAVGLTGGAGQQVAASTGDGTGAIVALALALVQDAGESDRGKGENSGKLHLEIRLVNESERWR